MLALRLLGGLTLDNPSGQVLGRAAQKRRLALLAILASSAGVAVSREKLLALLWPEVAPSEARHRLTVALYDLRQALGDRAIAVTPIEAMLAPEALAVDTAEFEVALRSEEWERAVAMYAGPFLDGVYLVEAPVFEQWVDDRRAFLQREYARALEQAAHARTRAGDHVAAVDAWRKMAALDPYSAHAAVGLMRALDAAGDRTGAIRHAVAHAELLRAELETSPDSEVEQLAIELRRRPIAAAAEHHPVRLDAAPAAGDRLSQAGPVQHPERGARPRQVTVTVLSLAGVALIFAAGVFVAARRDVEAGSGMAAATARSAFDAGHAHMRAGRFDAAVDAFSRAISEDSAMASAHYALVLANFWADRPGWNPERQLEEAVKRRNGLNQLEGILLQGLIEWRAGKSYNAEALYRRAISVDSSSTEAWLQLGETLFHYNPARGRPIAEAGAVFEKVIALDPDHFGALWHLLQLAALEHDGAGVAEYSRRLLALGPDATRELDVRLFHAAATFDTTQFEQQFEKLRNADESLLFAAGWRVAVFAGNRDAAARLFTLLTDPARPHYARRIGHEQLLYLDLARRGVADPGRWLPTSAARDAAAQPSPWATFLLAAPPGLTPDRTALAWFRDSDTRELARPTNPSQNEALLYVSARAARAAAAVVLGDTIAALAALDELEQAELGGARDLSLHAGRRAATVRALHAWLSGRPRDALAWLDQSAVTPFLSSAAVDVESAQSTERYLRAEALLALGRTEEADGWYAGLGEHVIGDLIFLGPALQRRAEIADMRGDTTSARRFRARLAELWHSPTAESRSP